MTATAEAQYETREEGVFPAMVNDQQIISKAYQLRIGSQEDRFSSCPSPTDIDSIAKSLGLNIYSFIEDDETNTIASLVDSTLKEVYINSCYRHEEQAYVLAFEIGNIIFDLDPTHERWATYKSDLDLDNTSVKKHIYKARLFAFELLAPQAILIKYWDSSKPVRSNIAHMSDIFAVTPKMIEHRAKDLSLITESEKQTAFQY